MQPLFTTATNDLKDFLRNISKEQIHNIGGFRIYECGEDNYCDGAVEEIAFEHENKLTATVSGADEYTVIIEQKHDAIDGQCSCPYDRGAVCKHIVAALIFAMNDYDKIDVKKTNKKQNKSIPSAFNFETYLNALEKEELIRLLINYAPESFRKQIENSLAISV